MRLRFRRGRGWRHPRLARGTADPLGGTMTRAWFLRNIARPIAAILFLAAGLAGAEDVRVTDELPFVRTPQAVVDKMLEIAAVRSSDFLIDLGSGDGRIPITAARRYGARALGVDLDPQLVAQSRAAAQAEDVEREVTFEVRDLFATDLRAATVVTMYLLPEYNLRLRPKLLAELRAGARVVSHDWDMGEWAPDVKVELPVPNKPVGALKSSTVYLWIVPARVAGRWRFELECGDGHLEPVELDLTQTFQQLDGVARIRGRSVAIERGAVRGTQVFFRFDDEGETVRFEGRTTGDRIAGHVVPVGRRSQPWRALRAD